MTAEHWIILVGAFCMGACIGSFVNVVAFRLPRGLSFVTPRSACPTCGEPIAARDNIPLWSFLRLLGQCRWCGQPIPWRYIGVELLMGALVAECARQKLLPDPQLAGLLGVVVLTVFCGGLVVVALIDLERRIIPDQLSKPGILVGLIASAVYVPLHPATLGLLAIPELDAALDGVLGAASAALVMWAVSRGAAIVFKQEALGGGDVKLVAAMGAFLGLAGVGLAALVAVVGGTVIGLVVLVVWRSRFLAFGPFLAMGGVAIALWPRLVIGAVNWWSQFAAGLFL